MRLQVAIASSYDLMLKCIIVEKKRVEKKREKGKEKEEKEVFFCEES